MNETQFMVVLILIFSFLVVYNSNQLRRRVGELASKQSRTEAKLDALLRNAGVTYDPYANVDPGILDAIRAGKKIAAIKRYREISGVGLKEAKEYVEGLPR